MKQKSIVLTLRTPLTGKAIMDDSTIPINEPTITMYANSIQAQKELDKLVKKLRKKK